MTNKSTGAIVSLGNQKKFREMTLEEQIVYYQNKTSLLKKKQAEQRASHHQLIGYLFEKIFGDVDGTDADIESKLNYIRQVLMMYQNQNRSQSVPNDQSAVPSEQTDRAAQAGTMPEHPA
ncbi:MAG: hypothetical protein K6F28_10530 [Lachnospiraceae bacterium]|nr:hypothetical protein [Lachnospiraceae bacterium]